MTAAVITADIVNSTRLAKADMKKLMKSLTSLMQPHKFEFYRGDSFQVLVKTPGEALRLVLQLRLAAMKLTMESSIPLADIRASIGIGEVRPSSKSLQAATDEAFVLSGRAFDEIKKDERLLISCNTGNAIVQTGLRVVAIFVEYLFQRITSKQAAVVYELLLNHTQVETARLLKKSQATVHKHMQSSGWPEIEKILPEYKFLVEGIQN